MNYSNAIQFKRNNLSEKIAHLSASVTAITKLLKLQAIKKGSANRKLVISTNWLDAVCFTKGSSVVETVIGNLKGLHISLADKSDPDSKLVYSRSYKTRDDETLMDIRSQKKIKEGLGDASHAHITFTKGLLTILPVFNAESKAIPEHSRITFATNDSIYGSILMAIKVIKENKFAQITIDGGHDFSGTHECTLLLMQLRRIGYETCIDDHGFISGKLSDIEIIKYSEVELVDYPINRQPVNFNIEDPLSTIAVCTAGVDAHSLEADEFNVSAIWDYRPVEPRDVKKSKCKITGDINKVINDKTESGAICAAINTKAPKLIINEDIFKFNFDLVSKHFSKYNFLHISLTCTEFTNLKNKADQERAIKDLSSSRDMIFPALDLIERIDVPTLLVENVKNFSKSIECGIFEYQLKKLGYKIFKHDLNAADYNGYTTRNRSFIFATKLSNSFSWPTPIERTIHLWNDLVIHNLERFRDITHTVSLQKALLSTRLRAVKEGAEVGPTITRSQGRQTKDACYFKFGDHYYMPDNFILKKMMEIDDSFDLSLFTSETQTEIIGQSVSISVHSKISACIKAHISGYAKTLNTIAQSTSNYLQPNAQYSLF
jgi:site-specific DNA-cytosine methylase